MFTLLNPFALLALAGLLVPVAIHLWNRRPGREVAVGSLRWLATGANRRLRNLKLEQVWLLLLRTALLVVLAVAVAGPGWRQPQPASRGVVLLSAEAARLPALAGLKTSIDSLRRRGYALRWLAAGFPRVSDTTWRALATGRPNPAADSAAAAPPTDFGWARVQQAVATFPNQPLVVVTSTALQHFRGSHAPLPAAVSWRLLPDTTTTTWLAAAGLVDDSLQLLIGRSSESQTTYRRTKVLQPLDGQPIRVAGLAPVRLRPNENGRDNLVVVPAASPESGNGVGVEAVPTVIEIYATPEYAADARYLAAALRAAAAGLAIPPVLRLVKARPARLNAGWTFWLSAEPLPPNWQKAVASNARIWREATGLGVADTSTLATSEPAAAPVTVFRRGSTAPARGSQTVWADAQGRAILSRQPLRRGAVYQLHTRLNPAWSALADDPQLPSRLLELLQPEPTDNTDPAQSRFARAEATHDRRALDPAQLPAATDFSASLAGSDGPKDRISPTFRFTDLRPWLVLAAGLLFLFERLLARRRQARTLSTPQL